MITGSYNGADVPGFVLAVLAILAILASGSGSILESIGVPRAGVSGGRFLDLVAPPRQWLYFLGLGVDLLGFVCVAAALHRL